MLRHTAFSFLNDESGATAIEYGLIAAMIAISCIAAITAFGNSINELFGVVEDKAGGAIDAAAGG
jgi:pilus assembly protein Flp/PilA